MFFLLFLFNFVNGFNFFLPAESNFCFAEDLSFQTLSIIELSSKEELLLSISDPDSDLLYSSSSTTHKFSFTALNSGIYSYCIKNSRNNIVQISISVKSGIKAKDYSNIASTKELKSIELKLKKLEDQTKEIHKKIQFLREREEEMKNTNMTIQNRVIGYSLCTLLMLVCLALIQVLNLKRHFKAKKMI